MFKILWLLLLSAISFAMPASLEGDYKNLDHTVSIERLRAGNHDDSGTNKYYFTSEITILRNTIEDNAGEEASEKRPKYTKEPQKFASIEIAVLTEWKNSEEETKKMSLEIFGDKLRTYVAEAMLKYEVKESQLAIKNKITLYEDDSFLYFFGEQKKVAEKEYFILPFSIANNQLRQNLKLSMKDDLASEVDLQVTYKKPYLDKNAAEETE